MNKSNFYSIIAYTVMFVGLAVSNVLTVLAIHDPRPMFITDDIFFAIISAVIFCLIMIGTMTALSIKKVVDGVYYRENSSRAGMRVVSYILLIYSYLLGSTTMILYHAADKQESIQSISNATIINPIMTSLLISLFVILFLYMLSIRVERKKK